MSEFKMPKIKLGDHVIWLGHGDRASAPILGIVTAVNLENVCLWTLQPSMHNGQPYDGVRHVDDPRLKQAEIRELGAWEGLEEYYNRIESEKTEAAREAAKQSKVAKVGV